MASGSERSSQTLHGSFIIALARSLRSITLCTYDDADEISACRRESPPSRTFNLWFQRAFPRPARMESWASRTSHIRLAQVRKDGGRTARRGFYFRNVTESCCSWCAAAEPRTSIRPQPGHHDSDAAVASQPQADEHIRSSSIAAGGPRLECSAVANGAAGGLGQSGGRCYTRHGSYSYTGHGNRRGMTLR